VEHGGIVLPADLGLGGAADVAGVRDSPISPRCLVAGAATNREHGGRLPRLHGIQNRARNRTRSGAEQRARTTAVTILAAAQIGTSGVLADGKYGRHHSAWATPRTGSVLGPPPSECRLDSLIPKTSSEIGGSPD
jgi:hypothetical protein